MPRSLEEAKPDTKNPVPRIRELAETPIEDMGVVELRELRRMPSDHLGLVVSKALEQEPPNYGVVNAVGGIALERLNSHFPEDRNLGSRDSHLGVAAAAFPGIRPNDIHAL